MLPLPSEGRGSHEYWTHQIEAAEERRNQRKEADWDPAIQSYQAKTLQTLPQYDTVVVPKDFANIERKKADLFFQNPDVRLKPRLPGLEDAVTIFQPVINHKLGPDGVDAAALMLECVTDGCLTALMCSKIGYESFDDGTVDIQTADRAIEPSGLPPGAILGLGPETAAPTAPIVEPVPRIVHERYFWERVSPAKVLIPSDFRGFTYDKAPWLGYEFEEDVDILRRQYHLADDVPISGGKDPEYLKSETPLPAHRADPKRVRGWEIWYRASLYDPSVIHPDQLRRLVLIDGMEDPVAHDDSPYQTVQPNGRLIGMIGFPVHIGALRYLSDSAYPPSETTIGRSQVEELSKSRTQMLLQRDRNVPMRWADPGRIGGRETLDKLQRNIWQSIVPIPGADQHNLPIGEIPRSGYPPEDFRFNDIIERDLNDVWAFGSNQRGQENQGRRTATEIRTVQGNVSARLDFERRLVIRFFVRGVEKLGALIQKFATEEEYIEIIGQDLAPRLQVWNKDTIAGEFVYEAQPDSSVRLDADSEFRDVLEMYNLTARDPHANRTELLIKMARLRNLDPQKFVVPQLPAKTPPPPSVAFTIKGEDLQPNNPAFPIVIELLTQSGYQVSDQAITAAVQHAQAQSQLMTAAGVGAGAALPGAGATPIGPPAGGEHPGLAQQAERLSKHVSERSTELSGPRTRPHE